MIGKGRELADMMEQRNCAYRKQSRNVVKQETLEVDANYFTTKLIEEKNGIGIMVREELTKSVLEVKRVSDRLIAMKLEVKMIFGKTWIG